MAEYIKSPYRNVDELNEKYMHPILNQIYEKLGFQVERVEDKERQIRGADVVLCGHNLEIVADEKCDMTRQLYVYNTDYTPNGCERDAACTFAVELSRRNRDGRLAKGWIYPDERQRALNPYYIFVWTNHTKDRDDRSGKIVKISQVEVCIIHYDEIRKIIESSLSNSYDDAIRDVYEKISGKEKELVRFDWINDTRIVYSGFLVEQPINCVIRKSALRKNAYMSFAFNLEGENGKEKIVAVRRLHFDEMHPKEKFNNGFVKLI